MRTRKPVSTPPGLAEVLDRHHVAYVLVGGDAANLHGAARPTTTWTSGPSTTAENLDRLAVALRELKAGIRVDELPDGLPFDTSAEALRHQHRL